VRRGIDCANAAYAPDGYDIYLGYVDGNYQSYPALKKRFPGKLVVPIAVFPSTNAGTVFDGPPDNSTWPQVVDWVVMRRKAGVDPTVYTDASDWATGVQAFNARGVPGPHWWIASWNGVQDIPAGAIGHQYQEVPQRYDVSVFADYWPGVDSKPSAPAPPPVVPASPAVPKDDEMAFLIGVKPDPTGPANNSGEGIFMVSGSLVVHVDGASYPALQAALGPSRSVSPAFYQSLVAAGAALQGHLSGSLNVSGTLQAQ